MLFSYQRLKLSSLCLITLAFDGRFFLYKVVYYVENQLNFRQKYST